MARPSAFAVERLMTSSNLVVCSTGRSPGLAPLRALRIVAAKANNLQEGMSARLLERSRVGHLETLHTNGAFSGKFKRPSFSSRPLL